MSWPLVTIKTYRQASIAETGAVSFVLKARFCTIRPRSAPTCTTASSRELLARPAREMGMGKVRHLPSTSVPGCRVSASGAELIPCTVGAPVASAKSGVPPRWLQEAAFGGSLPASCGRPGAPVTEAYYKSQHQRKHLLGLRGMPRIIRSCINVHER